MRKYVEKSQMEILLAMFKEYENFAKDGALVINTIRKKLDGNTTLEQFETEVIQGHVRELMKNLQGIDGFIDIVSKK